MRKIYALLILMLGTGLLQFSMAQQPGVQEPCIAEEMRRLEEAADPEISKRRAALENYTRQFVSERENDPAAKTSNAVKIIPVVVHIIHEGGTENISEAQVIDGIRVLNEDFRRLNADASNTHSAWQSVAADCEVEFRLAQKDPNGNCTNGITRTYSELTNDARNNVKGLIMWPRDKYMNVWLVKTIENTSGGSGFIIGFAQFPGGNSSTDGVVVRNDYWGAVGTANLTYKGRTASHEVGHWLNLSHIWGDSNCGNDFVSDTPTHETSNTGCPSFPHVTSCGNAPDGEMVQNYMDYTNGGCQNLFSEGQKSRMLAALNSSTSGRNNLWSSSNLAATGTDGSPATLCAPHAEFSANSVMLCAGDSITFTDESWNGTPDTWNWTFTGGSPSGSSLQSPTVIYNTPGVYNVTLTSSNATGSDSETKTSYIMVSNPAGQYGTMPFTDSFENAADVANDWIFVNPDNGIGWERYGSAGYTGNASLRLRNDQNSANRVDAAISPGYDIDSIIGPKLKFRVAYAQNTTSDNDKLRVYVSTNCGATWLLRTQKSGTQIATVSAQASEFTPTNASQWKEETVSLAPYAGSSNLRIKFEFTNDGGNNIFLDDINITGDGFVGLDDRLAVEMNTLLYPNPTDGSSMLRFTLPHAVEADIRVFDMMGREVDIIQNQIKLSAGTHQYTINKETAGGPGIYMISIRLGGAFITRKLVIQ
ncbi:MAG: T9SS type A sorting domain-containing protein [Flavobacteriales bacterium]|nr:T9SS type A sorting domain-containing protein [Flavobacteriales bacterium]